MALIFCLEDEASGATIGWGTGARYETDEQSSHAFSRLFDDSEGLGVSLYRLRRSDGSWIVAGVSPTFEDIHRFALTGRWGYDRGARSERIADLGEALPFLLKRRREQLRASGGGPFVRHGVNIGVAGGKRVGRNDPCPCGSGRKFKRCHGA
jgi:hypothetical protein